MKQLFKPFVTLTALLALFSLLIVPHSAALAASTIGGDIVGAPVDTPTAITVNVTDSSGAPLANAAIQIAPLNLSATTNAKGQASFTGLALTKPTKVEVAVQAASYRPWELHNATVLPNDTLIVDAPLSVGTTTEVIEVQEPRPAGVNPTPNTNPNSTMPAPNAINAYSLPSTIKVKRVSLGRIDTVNFDYYVKHVLPNEWFPSWNSNSLKAGAVAAKEFAWYNTSIHRKYYWTTAYDVLDTTADQVYNPNVSYASTNNAVDATWSTIVLKSGAPFQTQFCDGSSNASRTSGQCGEKYGYNNFPSGYFMSQYGSQYLASNYGYSWQSILTFYYTNSTLGSVSGGSGGGSGTWPVLRNGDSGVKVQAMQYLLRQRGYNITADGIFGSGTESAVRSFQSSQGLTSDGIVGANTFSKLVVTVRQGDSNNAVSGIQVLLNIQNTGIFGSTTDQIVRQFQQSHGLSVDGIVGPNTWEAAFGQ